MPILVTGATGFLGSRLIRVLINDGQYVIAIARVSVPDDYVDHPMVHWIVRDIAKEGLDGLEWPHLDAVVHLAGATLGAGTDEFEFLQANEQTLVRLLQVTAKHCKHFVFASSQVVYGNVQNLQVNEEQPVRADSSAYACSKLNSENWIRWFQHRYGGCYYFMRFSGFVDGGGIIDYMIDRALEDEAIELFSNGEVRRDYMSSSDGINALLLAIKSCEVEGVYPVNLGSGQIVAAIDLAREVCSELNSSSNIVLLDCPAPQADFVFDIDRAHSLLGFQPEHLLESVRHHAQYRLASYRK
jgi:UDP-glucose 4-epimerase